MLDFDLAGLELGEVEDAVDDSEEGLAGASCGLDKALRRRSQLGLANEFEHAENAVQRRANFVTHIGQELRFGPNRSLQLDRAPLDPRLERRIQLAQLLLGALLSRMARRECIGHLLERPSTPSYFSRPILAMCTRSIVPLAP